MKKNEDTKRHLKGERIVLKAGHWVSSKTVCLLVIFIFLILQETFPQIPINGFCLLNDFNIPQGYEKILSTELVIDQSSATDEFILYSPSLKKVCIFIPASKSFYEFETAFEISQLKELKDKNQNSKRFVFTSRRKRTAGIFEINSDTLNNFIPPLFKSQITFDSYPENIYSADVNSDGFEEILISGSSFDGISILFSSADRLSEKKIVAGSSFKDAVFIDLNNDGLKDIAGFNLIDNSLQFFYNDRKSNFKLVRTFQQDDIIDLLKTHDIDRDGFADIIYCRGNTLQIKFGDFQSSYNDKITISLNAKPDAIQFGDYNNDKNNDVLYFNSQSGRINILFGKGTRKFYDDIIYHINSSISAIATFQNNKKNNLAYITTDGLLAAIGLYRSTASRLKIVPAVKPGAISKFDFDNDGILDFCFIDEYDNSLKIFQRDKNGVPVNLYSYLLSEKHDEIIVDDFYLRRKTFYCYSKESRLIEALRINFRNGKFINQQLYSPGKLKDLAIKRADSSLVNIYMLYDKQNKLYPGKFEHRELSTTFDELPLVDRNVISAELLLNGSRTVYYWKQTVDSLFFNKAIIRNEPYSYRGFFGFPKYISTSITLAADDKVIKSEYQLVTFFNSGPNIFASLFTGDDYKIVYPGDTEIVLDSLNYKQIFFPVRPLGDRFAKNEIVIYLPEKGWFYGMSLSSDGKKYNLFPLAEAKDAADYFIDKFNDNDTNLIYTNKKEGFISIVLLKK
jgi:hypothetical protein